MEKFNHSYSNGEVTVTFKPRKCIHSTICISNLPKVFNLSKTPWIDINGASTEEIIKVVEQCPSGALTYTRDNVGNSDKKMSEPTKKEIDVQLLKNGPILVKADVKITHEDGSVSTRQGMTAFCRCGKSKAQPFCDGSHAK